VSTPSAFRRSDRAAGIRALAVCVACLTAALLPGCRGRARPDVLLITLDTTRADHLGTYGYPQPTTPALDALAAEGAVFTQAYTTNPITLPAHSSMLTGTYPMFHGVRDNGTYVLRDDVTTLAEVLSAQGYETAAFVASFVLDSRFGLGQGFGFYDDDVGAEWSRDELAARTPNAFGFAERKANLVTTAANRWIRGPRSRPYFAWLHYFDPHQPVTPPEPHHSRFTDGYDGEIAFADEQIGQVFAELKRRGTWDNTLIVVVGDHGEGLLEHSEVSHSLLIFDSTMRVPFLVKLPGGKPQPRRVDAVVSVVDVMPTVLSALGIAVPAEVQGRSLVSLARGGTPDGRRAVYMESLLPRLTCGWGELRGIRVGAEKLIWGPKPRLYRVAEDPGEVYDLAAREPETVARLEKELRGALRTWSRQASPGSVTAPDPETVQRLAALGYVAGSAEAARGIREELEDARGRTDPHDKQRLFNLWSSALDDIRTGLNLEAIRKIETVLSGDPENTAAMTTLAGLYLEQAKRPEKAVELYEKSLAIDPYQEEAHYSMARIERARSNLPAALEHCHAILRFEPRSVRGLSQLGSILQSMGRLAEAQTAFEQTLKVEPDHAPSLLALGALHGRAGRLAEAGTYLKRAQALEPNHPAVLYDVAIWYLQEGNVKEAQSHLERVLALKPTDPDALYVLGKLLHEQGDDARARPLLERARRLASTEDRRQRIDGMLHDPDLTGVTK
jgi:arylsulfatase A-like enzyme/Flp pilus assembly protein TadD